MPPAWHKGPSVPPRYPRKGCTDKVVYVNRQDANAALHRGDGRNLRPYRCWHCDQWHVTSGGRPVHGIGRK